MSIALVAIEQINLIQSQKKPSNFFFFFFLNAFIICVIGRTWNNVFKDFVTLSAAGVDIIQNKTTRTTRKINTINKFSFIMFFLLLYHRRLKSLLSKLTFKAFRFYSLFTFSALFNLNRVQ